MLAPRHIRTALWSIAAAIVFSLLLWFGRPFLIDADFGLSRLFYGWRDSRFAAFHRLFFEIKPGMSRADLEGAIRRVYPSDGQRLAPSFWIDEPTQITLFMNPETEKEPNCEGIILRLSNGTVVAKGYSMD